MINIKLTDILETGSQYTKNLPIAIIIGSVFLFIIFTIVPLNIYNVPSLSFAINNPSFMQLFIVSGQEGSANAGGILNSLNSLLIDLNSLYNSLQLQEINNVSVNSVLPMELKDLNIGCISKSLNNSTTTINDLFVLDFQQIEVLGHTLYTYASILFLLLSFILLLAMFSIIVISN